MDETGFLKVADTLSMGETEADWRTAISRAYYAAFHKARRLLQQGGFSVPRADKAHAYLWRRLSNSEHPDVNNAGRDLTHLAARGTGPITTSTRPSSTRWLWISSKVRRTSFNCSTISPRSRRFSLVSSTRSRSTNAMSCAKSPGVRDGPPLVQFQQPRQDRFVAQRRLPAVGREDRRVEFAVRQLQPGRTLVVEVRQRPLRQLAGRTPRLSAPAAESGPCRCRCASASWT